MANTGQTQGSMIAAIQSGQLAVGSAIAGSAGAVSSPADLEQTSILEKMKEIAIDTRQSIDEMVEIQAARFSFDKDAFRREQDRLRELEKERLKQNLNTDQAMKLPTKEEATGGLGKLGLAGLFAVAAFAKALNVDEILRLPQQLKSIKAMATFAKGVGTIGTLGFGPKILDTMKSAFKAIKIKPSETKLINAELAKKFKDLFKPITNIFENIRYQFRLFTMSLRQPMETFRKAIATGRKILRPVIAGITTAFNTIRATLKPITDTIKGLFGGGTGGTGVLSKILGPLKTLGRVFSKLFLPITLVLGVIDGVMGFMDEFGKTGSILDGIRGAVVGIVDLVMGLFSFDGERIMKGLGSMFSGVGGFFLNVLLAPLDMAANFIKDLFGFGDPEKPFSFKDMIIDSVMFVWDWVKGLFTIDFSSIKAKLFDIGKIAGAIASGAGAFVKAIPGSIVGGESPMAAFSRVYGEKMGEPTSGSTTTQNLTTDNSTGDMSTTTNNTKIMNEGGSTQGGTTIVNNQPVNVNNSQSTSANTINAVNLDTSTDGYWDRLSVAP